MLQRLLADRCEACDATGQVEVHHIRKLADLKGKGRKELPDWAKIMIARQRKTVVSAVAVMWPSMPEGHYHSKQCV